MRRHVSERSLATMLIVAASLLVLAGCGGTSHPSEPANNGEQHKAGPVVAADAADALQRAGAVAVETRDKISTSSLSLQSPAEAKGDIQLEGADPPGTRVVSVDGRIYINGDRDYWVSVGFSQSAARKVNNEWLRLPAAATDSPAFRAIRFDDLVKSLRVPSGKTYKPEVSTTTVSGQAAVRVESADGSVLFVAAIGEPVPLRLEQKGVNPETIDFGQWGQRTTIAAPSQFIEGPVSD
jgi:hypothetical protein